MSTIWVGISKINAGRYGAFIGSEQCLDIRKNGGEWEIAGQGGMGFWDQVCDTKSTLMEAKTAAVARLGGKEV